MPPLLFIGYFFLYPLTRIIWVALTGSETEAVGQVLSVSRLWEVAWFTLWQAVVSTVATVVLAWPITWATAKYCFRGRSLILAYITVPFVLPTVVVGTAFVALGWEGTIWAILAAHVFFNVAVVVRTVGSFWSRLDPTIVEAAHVLGASSWQAFRTITLPLLRPAIIAAGSIVFLFTFTSFGVVLILGDFRWRTLEVEIYRSALTYLDLSGAATLTLVQLAMVGLLLIFYSSWQRKMSTTMGLVPAPSVRKPIPVGLSGWGIRAVVASTVFAISIPLLTLGWRSLAEGGAGWKALFSDGTGTNTSTAIFNSMRYTLFATLIAVALGMMAALFLGRQTSAIAPNKSRSTDSTVLFDVVLMLPLGTSAVTIGYGFLVALGEPIDLRTSIFLIPIAHALVAMPFVIRSATPLLRSIRPELRQAAAMLGASPWRVFRVIDLPMVWRSALAGAGLAAAVSLGEFGATSFIVRPNTVTIPTQIFRWLSRPGPINLAAAMAMAVLLAVLTTMLILAVDRSPSAKVGQF